MQWLSSCYFPSFTPSVGCSGDPTAQGGGEKSLWATVLAAATATTSGAAKQQKQLIMLDTTTANAALLQACHKGALAEAQTLVHVHGARIHAAMNPETGSTPLHVAAAQGDLALLQWLLEWTAVQASMSSSSSMKFGMNRGSSDGRLLSIHEEEEEEDNEEEEDDGDYQDPINSDDDDNDGASPLIAPSVMHLLQATDVLGNTPLHYVCGNGRVDMIRIVAKAVASTTSTPSVACALWNDLLSQQNRNGRTPADWARRKNQAHVAVALEKAMTRRVTAK